MCQVRHVVRIRRELNVPLTSPVLGFIGRLYPVKGPRKMLRMMGEIARRRPDAVLLVAGDGPERSACEDIARDLDFRKNVRFLGQRNDIPELLAATDLIVMPSESEGLPLAAIEAMAAGRPVVGFDVGGFREIVEDRQSGRVIAPGNESAFVEAILTLLEDPQSLSAYGARAFSAAEQFSVERHVSGLLDCYRELAGIGNSANQAHVFSEG